MPAPTRQPRSGRRPVARLEMETDDCIRVWAVEQLFALAKCAVQRKRAPPAAPPPKPRHRAGVAEGKRKRGKAAKGEAAQADADDDEEEGEDAATPMEAEGKANGHAEPAPPCHSK